MEESIMLSNEMLDQIQKRLEIKEKIDTDLKKQEDDDQLLTIENLKKLYRSMGLEEKTTVKQKKNGTIMFYDPFVHCAYGFYPTGRFRRLPGSGYSGSASSNLNPTVMYTNEFGKKARCFINYPKNYVKMMTICIEKINSSRMQHAQSKMKEFETQVASGSDATISPDVIDKSLLSKMYSSLKKYTDYGIYQHR